LPGEKLKYVVFHGTTFQKGLWKNKSQLTKKKVAIFKKRGEADSPLWEPGWVDGRGEGGKSWSVGTKKTPGCVPKGKGGLEN